MENQVEIGLANNDSMQHLKGLHMIGNKRLSSITSARPSSIDDQDRLGDFNNIFPSYSKRKQIDVAIPKSSSSNLNSSVNDDNRLNSIRNCVSMDESKMLLSLKESGISNRSNNNNKVSKSFSFMKSNGDVNSIKRSLNVMNIDDEYDENDNKSSFFVPSAEDDDGDTSSNKNLSEKDSDNYISSKGNRYDKPKDILSKKNSRNREGSEEEDDDDDEQVWAGVGLGVIPTSKQSSTSLSNSIASKVKSSSSINLAEGQLSSSYTSRPLALINSSKESLLDLKEAARAANVSSRDVVCVFGDMLEKIAKRNDLNGSRSSSPLYYGPTIHTSASISSITPPPDIINKNAPSNLAMRGDKKGNLLSGSSSSLISSTSSQTGSAYSSIDSLQAKRNLSSSKLDGNNLLTKREASNTSLTNFDSIRPNGSSNSISNIGNKYQSFIGKSVPNVSLSWYLWRIVYYLNKYPEIEPSFFEADTNANDIAPSKEKGAIVKKTDDQSTLSRGLRCLLIALLYVDRICLIHPDFPITMLSIHRLILTAILIAAKVTDDLLIGERIFAKVGGVTIKELRKLELELCTLLQFDLNVSDLEFDRVCMKHLQLAFDVALSDAKQGKKRT